MQAMVRAVRAVEGDDDSDGRSGPRKAMGSAAAMRRGLRSMNGSGRFVDTKSNTVDSTMLTLISLDSSLLSSLFLSRFISLEFALPLSSLTCSFFLAQLCSLFLLFLMSSSVHTVDEELMAESLREGGDSENNKVAVVGVVVVVEVEILSEDKEERTRLKEP
ncbi:hypothetical protein Scep_029991 [Stephania cephalantha]|uniref:Uncharacterized protein n=1 Tax=Stephania cephalantha TaxID=152367 RepID=A0AAP0HI55_9MAGN